MSRVVNVGGVLIGGGNKISIQSMTNVKTENSVQLIRQINELQNAGADIVRVTVNSALAIDGFRAACKQCKIPLVADIHFDCDLALSAIEAGASKIRINPGNMSESGVKRICECLKYHNIPVRVGVNSGSIANDILNKYGNTAVALVESALQNVKLLEQNGVNDIVISVKSSDTLKTIQAYRLLAKKCDYPLHLGVTEAGGGEAAIIKSSVGIGSLLADGIGDTIRVSLSDDPVREVEVAKTLLGVLGLTKNYVDIVSCPTCGRTEFDVIGTAERLRKLLKNVNVPLKIAVMGCVVNGLGEGKEADFGIAGGKNNSVIFKEGQKICTLPNEQVEEYLIKLIFDKING